MTDNSFNFRTWLMDQQSADYQTIKEDEDNYQLQTDYAIAEIHFYHVEPDPDIVEFRITNLKDEQVKFFLHFALQDEQHAKELYAEMIDTLRQLKNKQKKQILLSCTAGLTTGYFAQQLNQAAEVLSSEYEFSAVPVSQLYEKGFGYEAILLAPQIGYEYQKVQQIFHDKPVIRMPAQIFGTYDTGACIQLLTSEMEKFQKTKEEQVFEKLSLNTNNENRVLIITLLASGENGMVKYRIYDHGKAGETTEVIKPLLTCQDLEDIIDTQISTCRCSSRKFDAIGIATPGIINEGRLDLPITHTIDLHYNHQNQSEIVKHFEEKYELPVTITNNVNAAVVGYYGQQDQYKTITLHSQPAGWPRGGQGVVIDGRLHVGAHHLTGELKYLINEFCFSGNLNAMAYDPEGMVEIIAKGLLTNIIMIDPEVILVRCPLTPDMRTIHKELEKYLPTSHIPDLVYVEDMSEYMMLGQLYATLQKLEGKR